LAVNGERFVVLTLEKQSVGEIPSDENQVVAVRFLDPVADYEPWPVPIDAEELFDEIMVRIRKEVIIEQHQLWVCGLWVMFSWVHPQMEFSPILYVTGPTMECGKTTLLNVIGKMVKPRAAPTRIR
jgi:hypothetical protein